MDAFSQLSLEYEVVMAAWYANQALEAAAPRDVRASGPSMTEKEVGQLRDLLASTQSLPPSTVSAQGRCLRGNAFYETGDFQAAVNEFSQAIRIDSGHVGAYNNLRNAHKNLGEYELASEDFNEAIRLHPDSSLRSFILIKETLC